MIPCNRNSAVDAIKGLMILLIVLHHLVLIPFLHHGYLAVDMFFMIAGYYLANHFKAKGGTAFQYTAGRFKQVYLPYLLALILATILDYKRLISFQGFEGFLETYAPYVAFLTLTEEMGFLSHWPIVLFGGWFLSVLIISGFLLFGLLEYNEKKTMELFKKEWYEDGWADGQAKGWADGQADSLAALVRNLPLLFPGISPEEAKKKAAELLKQ